VTKTHICGKMPNAKDLNRFVHYTNIQKLFDGTGCKMPVADIKIN
jgi:hypothetical protein